MSDRTAFRYSTTHLLKPGSRPETPLISVIVNNYNYDRYLGAALASIDAQTFRDFELIVVDDGSSDKSLSIARAHPTAAIICTERLNQARACLEAVRFSRGRYIYFLDADDEAEPGLLAAVALELATKPARVQVQLVPTDAEGHVLGPAFPGYPPGYDSAAMIADIRVRGMCIAPQTSANVFIRGTFDLIEDIAYETAIDGVSLLLSPFLGEVRSISSALVRYRIHGANESRGDTAKRFSRERRRFIDRLRHLETILASSGSALDLSTDPVDMSFARDRLIMEHFARRERIGWATAAGFLQALRRERAWRGTFKMTAWLAITALGPERVRRPLLQVHSDSWSPLRRPAALARAILRPERETRGRTHAPTT